MSLESILLAVLKEPATGYELKQAFDQTLQHFWSADMAQIYRTLQRLENAGQLKSKDAPSLKGPARRIYQRTAAGTKQLKKWLAAAPRLGNERLSHIAQLVFMHELDDLNQTLKFVENEPHKNLLTMPSADFHGSLGLQMGLDTLRLKLQWCDRSIVTIKKRIKHEER
jgi:DNA-binding PadR family transcriptional regulator